MATGPRALAPTGAVHDLAPRRHRSRRQRHWGVSHPRGGTMPDDPTPQPLFQIIDGKRELLKRPVASLYRKESE